jgi:LmbE family N-acetylglucosaminyl deacetylase
MRRLNPRAQLLLRRRWRRQRRTFRLFRPRRRVWRGIFWLTLLSLAALPSLHWANRWLYQQQRAKTEPLLHSLQPAALGDCVAVIAPHPDDETLQAGGLIAWLIQHRRRPSPLHRDGCDGYDAAIKLLYHDLHITDAHRHAFALRRRKETLEAMALLGVPPDHVHFLGFSERTLPARWLLHGDERPLRTLTDWLTTLQPTAVILPSRYDDHPVHAAVCSLTWAALLQAVASGSLPEVPFVLEALVHYGEFPRPQGLASRLGTASPNGFALRRPLVALPAPQRNPRPQRASHRLLSHPTPPFRRFLKSFVRANELFAEPLPLWRQPDRIGEPRSLLPFADLTEVTLVPLRPRWQLQMRLRGKPHHSYRYAVHWFVPATPRPFLAVTDALPSATMEASVLTSVMPFDAPSSVHETANPFTPAVVATAFVAHEGKVLDIAPLTVGALIRQALLSQTAQGRKASQLRGASTTKSKP